MTLFEKIINRQIPATIVFEDDAVIAFWDIGPVAPTHVLVVPKKPITSLAHAEPDDAVLLGRCLLATRAVAEHLGIAASGFRVVINSGSDAGQSVFHLHLHVLGGRTLSWPPG